MEILVLLLFQSKDLRSFNYLVAEGNITSPYTCLYADYSYLAEGEVMVLRRHNVILEPHITMFWKKWYMKRLECQPVL